MLGASDDENEAPPQDQVVEADKSKDEKPATDMVTVNKVDKSEIENKIQMIAFHTSLLELKYKANKIRKKEHKQK